MFKTAGLEERKECVKGDEKVKKSWKFSKKKVGGKAKKWSESTYHFKFKKGVGIEKLQTWKKEKIVIATRQYYERNLI